MKRWTLCVALAGLACTGEEPTPDAGAAAPLDAGTPDTGAASRPPDAGFGGGLGARCQRDTDCDNPSHKCLVGNYPNTYLRCSKTCVRGSRVLITPRAPVSRTKRSPVRSPPTVRRHGFGACRYLLLRPTPDLAPMGASRLMGAREGDTGSEPDAGAGQAPGSRCDRDEQCRHQRCLRGFSGDSFCAAPCVTDDDCAEFAPTPSSTRARSACVEDQGEGLCREVAAVPRPGWTASLERGLQDVRGRVTLTDQRTLRVRDFYYDGRRHGQEVYLALSLGPINADNGILVSINLRCRWPLPQWTPMRRDARDLQRRRL